MRGRCTNPARPDFHNYGGRGITYDPRWDDFRNFLADMGEKPIGMELDRIDNAGPYCKDNCRWATRKQQMENSRRSKMITYGGKTQNVSDWAKELGIGVMTLGFRLRNWTVEEAFTTPMWKGVRRKH